MSQLVIFIEVFFLFLFLQSSTHATLWRLEVYVLSREKVIWTFFRVLIFSLNAIFFQWTEGWQTYPEMIRLLSIQLTAFWVLFDIVLPLLADKPQLWNDDTLSDNVSFFDRLFGSWKGNLIAKGIGLGVALSWFAFTSPLDIAPIIPNYIALIGSALIGIGIVFFLYIKTKLSHGRSKSNS